MRLIANIPCTFGDKRYLIGEEIPLTAVADPKLQSERGVLTIMNDSESPKIVVPVLTDGDVPEEVSVTVTQDELHKAFVIMQSTSNDAVKAISEVKDENVLIIVSAVDSRSTVKSAAKKQASAIRE